MFERRNSFKTAVGGPAAVPRRRWAQRFTLWITPLAFLCAFGSTAVQSAYANSPIESFQIYPSTTQAGGHPDIIFKSKFGGAEQHREPCDCNDAKNIELNVPRGVIGNPHALPYCTAVEFASAQCPVDSQIGVASFGLGMVPLFNLEPSGGQAGLFGLTTPIIPFPVVTVLSARTDSDYGLRARLLGLVNFPSGLPLEELEFKLWGVPASPSDDPLRFHYGVPACFGSNTFDPPSLEWTQLLGHRGCTNPELFSPIASNSPEEPFIENPTSCDEPLSSSLDILSYDGGASNGVDLWPSTTGCDQLSFNPSIYAQPTTTETDTASGLDVDLSVPQTSSPTYPSPSELRAATVTLPKGMSINPNAADGKVSCSDAEARFGTEEEAHCPEFSRIGTLSLTSSALPAPLLGSIYLGKPKPGNRYRIFLAANGFSTHIKLDGSVQPDPATGQLVVSFQNLPETPFSDFNLHFFGSERGLLATPSQCGTYPVTSTFTPWDQALPEQTSTQFFTLNSGPAGAPCPGDARPFGPSFHAGVSDSTAAAHTHFSIELTRPDGDQDLAALNTTAPPGFSATLAGIPYCPDATLAAVQSSNYSGLAEQANPSCSPASQIGTATTGVGAGTHPVYLPGKVYLAGPYRGAPLSLAVITPALSGPYDLGNVVVRAALRVDPSTARITAVSDPLPQILQGIPLRLRSILIELNRPHFALNPTNCDPLAVAATVFGDQGAQASLSSHFQVASCANLPFAPKLTTAFSGGTRRTGNPALRAVLTYPAKAGAYANIASAAVTLPPTEIIDNAHIQDPCTRVQFAADACPPSSVIGYAKAETPLIEQPLEGPVYLMTGFSHKLPDLVADLRGQVDIVLDGHVETVHKRIRTTFETVPDVPVSRFTLSLDGGSKGLLENNTNLCLTTHRLSVEMVGQNGRTRDENPVLATSCAKPKRKAHHKKGVGR